VAADIGLLNVAVPLERLTEETLLIARELAQKDQHALKATKGGYRYSLEMPWGAAVNYDAAKEAELLYNLGDDGHIKGVGSFLDKKFKPGLESLESVAE